MLDDKAVQRIISHMNDDHADAVLMYAQVFAGRTQAVSARLVSFDERGMGILCSEPDGETECRVDFDKPLANAGEARQMLVNMVDRARQLSAG